MPGTSPAKAAAPKAAGDKTLTKGNVAHLKMVIEAIITLNERGGVTRQAIWKFMKTKYEKATSNERGEKLLAARLKRFADDGKYIVYGKLRSRFTLNQNFRTQLATRKAKGMEIPVAAEHALLKKSFNPKKKMTKNKKNTRAKTAKGRAKNTKKQTKKQQKKDTKRRTKAAATKAKKGAAKGGKAAERRGRSKSPAKGGRKPSKSPAGKGKAAAGNRKPSKSPAKGGRKASKSPAKGGRKASKSPAKGKK